MTVTPLESAAVHHFNFGGMTLRALLLDNEPWFLGADLAEVLDYRDGYTLLRGIDEEDKRVIDLSSITTHIARGNPNKTFVNESGMYQAILNAKTERVKPFKKWVTSEVLPTIRKTGQYTTPKTLEERSLELQRELMAVVASQKQELEVARPKAEVYDKVLTPAYTFNLTELTAELREHYPVNRNDVKALLQKRGLLYSMTLRATARAIDGGWAVQRPQGIFGGKERSQPRFTTKTLEWLLNEYKNLKDSA